MGVRQGLGHDLHTMDGQRVEGIGGGGGDAASRRVPEGLGGAGSRVGEGAGAHRDDVDVQLRVALQLRLVGERLEADLVERI